MDKASLRETRDLLKQIREEILLRPSGLRPVHLIHYRQSETRGDTAAVRSGKEKHVLDGDGTMADRRDIFESKLQGLVRDAFFCGFMHGLRRDIERFKGYKIYDSQIHELLVSYLDGPTGDVVAQDEVFEEGTMGDGVRSDPHLIPRDPNAFIVDEWDSIKKITDDFAHEMDLRFTRAGKKVAMGHCNLTKNPDGSIHASINFFPQNPR